MDKRAVKTSRKKEQSTNNKKNLAQIKNENAKWITKQFLETNVFAESLKLRHSTIRNIKIFPIIEQINLHFCEGYKIEVVLSNKGEPSFSKFSIFVKLRREVEQKENLMGDLDLFRTEALFYNKVEKKIQDILDQNKTEKITPQFYHYDIVNAAIFLEDVTNRSYSTSKTGHFLNLRQTILYVEALATLHGATHALVSQNPSLKMTFSQMVWVKINPTVLDKMHKVVANAFKKNSKLYKISDAWKERLKNFKRNDTDIFNVHNHKFNVLLHGDPSIKNCFFHYNQNVADSIILIDYQCVNYNSFAFDLHQLFFTSVASEIIVNKLDFLLKVYQTQLVKINPQLSGFSLEEIKKQFEEKMRFGYNLLFLVRPYIMMELREDVEEIPKEIAQMQIEDIGFTDKMYIKDVERLMPLFEKYNLHK